MKTSLLIGACVVYMLLPYGSEGADLPMVLPPIVSAGDEVVVLLIPGAYINAAMYQPLGEALQQATSLKLWVGLVGPFLMDFPNPEQCAQGIEDTLGMMKAMGMNSSVLFLAGHSMGGVVMQPWGWEHQSHVAGFILMASELVSNYTLSNSPVPIMHISGDLDGLETLAEVAPVYKELQSLAISEPQNKITFSVSILQDVNHMQFASGEVPPAVEISDILSPLPENEAHLLIATHVMAYVTAISGLPAQDVQSANDILNQDYEDTSVVMQPLFENYYLTDGGTFSEWSQIGQVIISSISEDNKDTLVVNDTLLSMEDLEASRPSIELFGNTAYINTYTHVDYDLNEEAVSAQEMAVKMKSREAVMAVVEPLGIAFNGNTSCRLINQNGFAAALASATDIQRERFTTRSKQIFFIEDDEKATGSAWVDSSIGYNQTETTLVVTSSSLHTDVAAGFGLGGMHYCKLMPPARMIEYIITLSLRGTQP